MKIRSRSQPNARAHSGLAAAVGRGPGPQSIKAARSGRVRGGRGGNGAPRVFHGAEYSRKIVLILYSGSLVYKMRHKTILAKLQSAGYFRHWLCCSRSAGLGSGSGDTAWAGACACTNAAAYFSCAIYTAAYSRAAARLGITTARDPTMPAFASYGVGNRGFSARVWTMDLTPAT